MSTEDQPHFSLADFNTNEETVPNRNIQDQILAAQQLLWNSQDVETQAMYLLHVQVGDDISQLPTLTNEELKQLELKFPDREFFTYGVAAKKIVLALRAHPVGMSAKTLEQFLKLQNSHIENFAELIAILTQIGMITRIQSNDGKQRFILKQPNR